MNRRWPPRRSSSRSSPEPTPEVLRSAWLVVGHSPLTSFITTARAETAYGKVLALLPAGDKARAALVDNLAASIYKQGEEAKAKGDFRAAANHFLRVATEGADLQDPADRRIRRRCGPDRAQGLGKGGHRADGIPQSLPRKHAAARGDQEDRLRLQGRGQAFAGGRGIRTHRKGIEGRRGPAGGPYRRGAAP